MTKVRKKAVESDPLSYTAKERNGYLIGMAGQNIIYGIISSGLAFYFSNVIALPAMAISVIMAIARVWDAINDPMMGTFVDKTKSKWGKCRPYLIFMPVIIMIGTILCFANGIYSEANNSTIQNVMIIAWAGISYIMWGMLYTAADIPLWGIASRMTAHESKRSNLLSLARMVAGIGGALGFVMTPIAQALAPMMPGNTAQALQWAFIVVAIVLAIVGTILFQCAALAKERVDCEEEKKRGIIDNFKIMWANKPFRRILISGIIRSPFQLLLILAMPLMTLYFGNNGATADFVKNILLQYGPIAVGVFGGQFGAMALTPILCKKFEKKTIFNVMNIVSGIAFALIFVLYLIFPTTLGGVPIILLAIAFLIASAGVGFIMVLQSMMIADCVDYEEHTNGTRPDGVFFSGQSFLTKLAAGLAVMIQGICYAIVGYEGDAVTSMNSALSSGLVTFAEEYRTFAMIMFFLVSIPPAIGMILSIIPMLKYELNDKEHSRILDELNAKRLANATGEVMTLESVENADGAENVETAENEESVSEEQTVDTAVMPVAEENTEQEAVVEEPIQDAPVEEVVSEEKAEEVATEEQVEVKEEVETTEEPATEE
ncbi:MAG: glycoside-pentoside-hexuronide (GPH):cation symporter, partial [Clostridia bacterium]|nr:glycoside-pentoside-hexuronide (GPH):cation symporter [Clostridia bacterium]